uniref:Uncharacterized protein n=1 Tax=uncultured Desulfobacterium sp. TaxID=201089 RepID=E1YGQ6_9BACT|nr:unknown protein [uncultured Desulfobacterium sp.]
MKQIGQYFNIDKSTSVSSIIERVKKLLQICFEMGAIPPS